MEHVFDIIEKNGTDGITMNGILINLYSRKKFIKYKLAEGWVNLTLKHLINSSKINEKNVNGNVKYFV